MHVLLSQLGKSAKGEKKNLNNSKEMFAHLLFEHVK